MNDAFKESRERIENFLFLAFLFCRYKVISIEIDGGKNGFNASDDYAAGYKFSQRG